MRHDFELTAWYAGERRDFLARDVPTAVFFRGFAESYPGADCFARMSAGEARQTLSGMEAWADALLCRAIVEPVLTPELVQRNLGSARDDLVVAYLAAVGWMPPDPDAVPARAVPAPDRAHPEDHAALLALPTPTIRRGLRELAVKARVAPYTIWARWGIVECWWTWRLLLSDDLKQRAARGGSSLPQSDLVDAVGREAS